MLILYFWNFRDITWSWHYLSAASLVCVFSIRWNVYFIIYLSCHNTEHTAEAHLDASPNCCLLLASLCGVVVAVSAGHIIRGITCPRCQMTTASHIRGFSLLLVIYHTSLLFKYCSVLILYFWNFRGITCPRYYLSADSVACCFSCPNMDQTAKARLVDTSHCCLLLAFLCGVMVAVSAGHMMRGITCPRCHMFAASPIHVLSL